MRGIIAEVSAAEDKEAAFYQALIRLSNEGVDISGMLEQYGALGVQLLSGAKSADELYAVLTRLENLSGLQVDLENADALAQAAKAIDPAQSGYDPLSALASYDLLEAKYAELMELQRGSAEYIQRARELTDEETAAVYRQAAAYEKERDQLLELAETKRNALNEELTMLDEQLEARKKLNEQEDRAKLLAEKEAQLARISADPTRKKEELALREEIADLREEIAWELAEQEVDAQKKSIESQIESIDNYMEYVETYYEELLSNPRKLIEEMQELLNRTDEEILAWLEANHEEYETATDATRESMRLGWQEMLDDMRGNTQTYWDEVEEIIAQGDEAIIEFLKQNSADYKEAGRLQAEAYVDEWKKKLEDLKNAYKQVSGEIKSYSYTPTSSGKSGGSGSSGGSSKSSGSGGAAKVKLYQATYPAIGSVKGGTLKGYATEAEAKKAAQSKINSICREQGGSGSSMIGEWARSLYSQIKVTAYARGGLARATGLAWLDGTKQKPERILSPYQTELFEDLLKTLHTIRTYQAPAAVVQPRLPEARQPSYHIDSITVQVQTLESDQDYEEMAERVGEHIMNKVTRGMSVGGIRLG